MIETIVALATIAFLYAYLYSKSPESNTASGFAFRILFLSMSLWTVWLLVWITYNSGNVTEVLKYDANGTYVGKEIWNTTLPTNIRDTLTTYLEITGWVPYITIAMIILFLLYNTFVEALRGGE